MSLLKKIILPIILVLTLSFCVDQKKSTIKNKNLLTIDANKNLVFKIPNYTKLSNTQDGYYIKEDSVFYTHINESSLDNSGKKLAEVIDQKTFDVLYNTEESKAKIKNEYYITNPLNNYFRDKNHIYIYQYMHSSKPKLFKAGDITECKILGGAYIQVGDTIYWRGEKLHDIDIATFRTTNVIGAKSEWETTIGIDKNHLYSGNTIMTYKNFKNHYIWQNEEDIAKHYFSPKS
ncbi:DKNYY domain-containing protein [Aquimarina longa]|uniref:DKNYY domain-containing protein n=1 Tax=Aquimarina longa TaxID=1080221 RepID=UPI0007830B5F|nr:DKNYY domain-containing protein [Aquimarina longa]